MNRYVIDTSVILDWIVYASDTKLPVHQLVDRLYCGDIELFAPGFLLVEVSNVLKQKYGYSQVQIELVVAQLEDMGVNFVDTGMEGWLELLKAAFKYSLTLYDAYYAYTALKIDSKIITRDKAILECGLGISAEEALVN